MTEGEMRFVLILPPEVAKLFEQEMKRLDRKKLPLARQIVTKYFEDQGKMEKVATLEPAKKQEMRTASPQANSNIWQLMGRRAMDRIPRFFP